jgi:hypothetical protein
MIIMTTSLFIWESTIGNISFLILLITTIYYWVNIIFFYPSVDHQFFINQTPIIINNLIKMPVFLNENSYIRILIYILK